MTRSVLRQLGTSTLRGRPVNSNFFCARPITPQIPRGRRPLARQCFRPVPPRPPPWLGGLLRRRRGDAELTLDARQPLLERRQRLADRRQRLPELADHLGPDADDGPRRQPEASGGRLRPARQPLHRLLLVWPRLVRLGGGEQEHLLPDGRQRSGRDQDLGTHPVTLADQAEQDVLGADVLLFQRERLAQRQLEYLLRRRGERDVPRRRRLPRADERSDLLAGHLQGEPERHDGPRRDAVPLVDQPEQDVLGADVVVVKHPGLFLGQDHNAPRGLGEPLEHGISPSGIGGRGDIVSRYAAPRRESKNECFIPKRPRRASAPGRRRRRRPASAGLVRRR